MLISSYFLDYFIVTQENNSITRAYSEISIDIGEVI